MLECGGNGSKYMKIVVVGLKYFWDRFIVVLRITKRWIYRKIICWKDVSEFLKEWGIEELRFERGELWRGVV